MRACEIRWQYDLAKTDFFSKQVELCPKMCILVLEPIVGESQNRKNTLEIPIDAFSDTSFMPANDTNWGGGTSEFDSKAPRTFRG